LRPAAQPAGVRGRPGAGLQPGGACFGGGRGPRGGRGPDAGGRLAAAGRRARRAAAPPAPRVPGEGLPAGQPRAPAQALRAGATHLCRANALHTTRGAGAEHRPGVKHGQLGGVLDALRLRMCRVRREMACLLAILARLRKHCAGVALRQRHSFESVLHKTVTAGEKVPCEVMTCSTTALCAACAKPAPELAILSPWVLWSRQYEPTIAELQRKYEVVVRERALLVLQRDRLTAAISMQVCRCRVLALKGHAIHVLAWCKPVC